MRIALFFLLLLAMLLVAPSMARAVDAAPDYRKDITPILNKYCTGCHNADDRDGELVMESYRHLMKGGEHGAPITPGKGDESLLIQVLTGKAKPKMPPKKKPAPSADEIALIKRWIDAGASGPADAASDVPPLTVPTVKPAANLPRPVTALAGSPDGKLLAIGRYGEVELVTAAKLARVRLFTGLPGKVNALNFSKDGTRLVAASGVNGLYGKAILFNVETGDVVREFTGHRDTMYDALLSPDGAILATCSYDRRIILWNAATGDELRTITGHNDAVYDLAFNADGAVLASASGDQTVKVWKVATGERLDTLHQPTAEQFAVAFSPDDKYIVAGGIDNRIRVWKFVSREKEMINPLVHARFAHEGAIVRLAFANDGQSLVSAAEDGTIKLWETQGFSQVRDYETQPDAPSALATWPRGDTFIVGRMNGTMQSYPLRGGDTKEPAQPAAIDVNAPPAASGNDVKPTSVAEKEPNDSPSDATSVATPATITGVINAAAGATSDADLFRFESKAGEQWVLEINAARSKSPLDSKLEVLDASGARIERVLLEAVRDSYFTFRGKDSNTVDDFRVFNWQEMELNDLLYADGEVVKLWHYPRGPDSGFMVYPGMGTRYGYYDTTPLAHALQAPCYIVRPHRPADRASIIPNGLPVFTLYYENDDDSNRRFGADSQLMFTAPRDGAYLARVTDVRGFHGPDYKYHLTIRPRRPDFTARIEDANPTVNAGSGKEFGVKVDRIDGYDGPIRVDIEGLPPGFSVTTPIIVEPEQIAAYGVISAAPDAPQPTEEQAKATKVTATALINGKDVTKVAGSLGTIKLAEKPKLLVRIEPSKESGAAPPPDSSAAAAEPLELTIHPGETITARVVVERNGFNGRVEFGNADAGRNLPYGVYVDNIGLNGLLVVEGQNERTFFITASKVAEPTSRLFFLRTKAEGTQTSQPVMLHVRGVMLKK